jgi:hypothetical protein
MKRKSAIRLIGVGVRGLRRRVGSFKHSRGQAVRGKKPPVLTAKKHPRVELDPYEQIIAEFDRQKGE